MMLLGATQHRKRLIAQAPASQAETGDVRVEVELFAFEDAPIAYQRFREGDLRSRAVVTPNG